LKRTIQSPTTQDSSATDALVNFGRNRRRVFVYATLIVFLVTLHFWFAASGRAQEPTKTKVNRSGLDQAKSSMAIAQPLPMPDLSTGAFTLAEAKRVLATTYKQERIRSPDPEPSYLPEGRIFAQDPPAGTPLNRDTVITLHVSNGTPPITPQNPTADLSVINTLVNKKREFWAGEQVQYSIVVSNAGPSTATNVKITDAAINLSNLTFDTTGGECTRSICSIKSIDAGSSAKISVTATIAANGSFRNLVTVTADEPDPQIGDNTSEDNADANPAADVSAKERLDTDGPFRAGQSVQYAVTVSNAGPSNATNIKIVEKPSNLTIREVSGECNKFPCTLPNLAGGAIATIIVTASIDRDGPFQNVADVEATERDVDPDNNKTLNLGGIATSYLPPPPFPPPWVWPVLILVVGGLTAVGGGTYVIWHWTTSPPPSPVSPVQPPVSSPPDVSQLPPIPVINTSVDLRPGTSVIEGLKMTGPQIRLRTGLEMGGSTFNGAVPIVKREVINE